MNIAMLNRLPSRIDINKEALSLYPLTLLSEKLALMASIALAFIQYNDFDRLPDEIVLDKLRYAAKNSPEYLADLDDFEEKRKIVRKLKNQKYKDKATLHIIGVEKQMMRILKQDLLKIYLDKLKELKILELVNFDKENIWSNFPVLIASYDAKEDIYVSTLITVIRENLLMMSFDALVEADFKHIDFDSSDNQFCDFIKIPLWHFPMFDGITFNQMKYTLDDLKPSLKPFKEAFAQLKDELFTKQYTLETFAEIKQNCREHLQAHIGPIQQAIDDSLYISQLRNQTKGDTGLQFCLGITSADMLVNYYEKAEIIPPYVASETKDQLSRHIDLKAGCMFCYVKTINQI